VFINAFDQQGASGGRRGGGPAALTSADDAAAGLVSRAKYPEFLTTAGAAARRPHDHRRCPTQAAVYGESFSWFAKNFI